MKEPTIDAERLAAMLDGRLGRAEREELLARLAAADDAFEAYADAVASIAELEATGKTGVTGAGAAPHPGGRRRAPAWQWAAIAAALAGVALAPWLLTRARSADQDDPARFVSTLAASGGQLPAHWSATPWPGMRGAGQPLSAMARAARLGARLVDLELAVRARDTTVAGLTAEITSLLEDLPAASPVAAMYREAGQRAGAGAAPAELEPLLERARLAATTLAADDAFQLAAWAEAGRVAAARRDADFFAAPESRALLERAPELSSLLEPARAAVQRLQSDLPAGSPPVWSALEPDLSELLRVLGS